MTKTEFLEKVAEYVQLYAPKYDIRVCSPIIAQAILESNWGMSVLSAKYYNFFGLKCGSKWVGKSVNLKTQEEYTVGVKTTIKDNFRVYSSMGEGIKGYFEFIQADRYKNLKGITDPKKYLETLKADGYATDSKYVESNLEIIRAYNLVRYDDMSYIGQASVDERGTFWNGKAGDQTGKEVAIRSYYNYPWNVFLAPKSTDLGDKIANAMIDACNNNHIGYDMNQRNTAYTQWKKYGSIAKIVTDCETDCSALTSLCVTQAGVDILSGTTNAPTTSTLRRVLLGTGKFEVVSSPKKRGTVCLKEGNHVAVFLGDSAEKKTIDEAQPTTSPINSNGIKYQAHSQSYGWLPQVRDGQTAGTVGKSKRVEALKIDVSAIKGMSLDVKAHIQGIGWKTYKNVTKDTVIGTTGQSKRIEALELVASGVPKDKKLKYRVHVQTLGWTSWAENTYPVGTMGQSLRIEAIQIVLE